MIKSLEIRNIALIEQLNINFEPGLTVLSGETGSGKSIIIDSLAFVLGDRADKTLIKHGTEYAEVTAIFEVEQNSPILDKLSQFGFVADQEILVYRKMSLAGKNEIRIQGKTATLAILKEICSELVDIFGQGQHLALLNEQNQLSVLDSFCDFGGVDIQLSEQLYPQLLDINKQLRNFGGSDAERQRLLDILRFQIDELENAELSEEEEEELVAAHKRMVNIEKIASALNTVVQCLSEEGGAVDNLSSSASALSSIAGVEQQAVDLENRLNSVQIEVDDIAQTARDLLSSTEFSPYEVDRIESRLEKIRQIKRKYGGTVKDALQFLADAQAQYDNLSNAAEIIEDLNNQKHFVLQQMYDCAVTKSDIRKQTAKRLAQDIISELECIGMKGTNFVVDFCPVPTLEEYSVAPNSDGFDTVSFLMSANIGEPLKPLAKVISGGEMSRFMLAVKNITAMAEKIPTMVFDEIDTGISGAMAQMVAMKLANVAHDEQNGYQCIVITHLPQIVAMADVNLYIEKYQQNNRTFTSVTQLDSQGRVREVARLMGGVGEHAFVNATELIGWSDSFKKTL